jgi:phospholipid/cholesterol/gamma-HCH transport system substrate-binding protein
MRRLAKVVGGLALIAVVGAGIYFSVRAAYGAYGDYYYVTATMDRTGQQLLLESDVRVKGVEVGKVSDIQLVDHKAVVELQIEDQYQIPKDVTAFVSLKTPLGAKYVDLRFPPEASGPYLANGDTIENAHVGPELEDLLADGVKVLEAFDPEDAGTIITTLAEASRNRGDTIARGLENNAELSKLFADTTDPQIENFKNFSEIFAALEERGADLNDLAFALNEGVPVYASEEAQAKMSASLSALVPFAEDFSDLLIYNREDWDRMMDGGYAVLNTVASRPEGLHDLVYGLYRYVYKLGGAIPDFFMVEDGSAGAGFINFIGGNDQKEEEKQICAAFPPEEREKIPACAEGGP